MVQAGFSGTVEQGLGKTRQQHGSHPFCRWIPQEEALEFVRKANEAKAVMDIAARVREYLNNKHEGGREYIPPEIVRVLDRSAVAWPLEDRHATSRRVRSVLESTVNRYLWALSGPYLFLTWPQVEKPNLDISNGRGFIHVVWMKIAQILCDAKGVYQCGGCRRHYVRSGRKPQAGRQNYCPECGAQGKHTAAKRAWWAGNHGREHR
jgi:hypothetical protein